MKNTIGLIIFLNICIVGAQSIENVTLSNGGNAISNGSNSINATIGEPIIGVISNNETLLQGFWFSSTLNSTLTTTNFSLEDNILLYPNPVINNLTILLKDTKSYNMSLWTLQGQLIMKKDFKGIPNGHKINFSALSKGVYVLKLSIDDINQNKTFRIIKK
ncbi:T9SS type A sorting domain-containing protein [uncultured Algibacter sp.]|uniref:T9SS type A sorting domain-containing protein n=1 Tax=uncultured Algibacter sp. TaxID=298659 RepID=UPI002636152C|nr:T9SS type A sorting domain-containing protein [uncultured Algibacter sp.]